MTSTPVSKPEEIKLEATNTSLEAGDQPKKVSSNGESRESKPTNSDSREDEMSKVKANGNHPPKDEPDGKKSSAKSTPKVSSKKRKAQTTSTPNKAPRRSARSTPKTQVIPLQILRYLLSPSSLPHCRPRDEVGALKTRDANTRTYASLDFNPFEELACAVILSRPISHALGVRSIRTLFNKPYEFSTPLALRDAGAEGRRKALDEARTQHRQKTADELGGLADAVVERLGDGEEDTRLERVRKEAGYDLDKERELLKKSIKGLGNTGLDIFFRRVQAQWEEVYPFIDARTTGALKNLGLPDDAEELSELLNGNLSELEVADMIVTDEKEKQRKLFVQILERAVGADLEGNIDAIKSEAGNLE